MNYSAVIQRYVEQAKELGLQVSVMVEDGDVLQSVIVDIRRPTIDDPANMLEVIQNAESVHLHSVRCFNEGRWTNHATFWGFGTKGAWMSLRSVKYRLEIMAGV